MSWAITVGYLPRSPVTGAAEVPKELEGALQIRGAVRIEQGPETTTHSAGPEISLYLVG